MSEMKLILAIFLAFLSVGNAIADTYIYTDENGRMVFTDRRPSSGNFKVVHHPSPAPVVAPAPVKTFNQPVSTTEGMAAYIAAEKRRVEMVTADAMSAIKERDRKQTLECLALQQRMDRISSSRNFTVDPDTGGSLEERGMRETRDAYKAICSG